MKYLLVWVLIGNPSMGETPIATSSAVVDSLELCNQAKIKMMANIRGILPSLGASPTDNIGVSVECYQTASPYIRDPAQQTEGHSNG